MHSVISRTNCLWKTLSKLVMSSFHKRLARPLLNRFRGQLFPKDARFYKLMSVLYYIYIYHYYKLQKHNSTYCMKDHLLLIQHCILHNQYKNHKCPVFEYNSPYYIESSHYRTIFLNMRQNQLKKTKQIFWIPEILLITQRRLKILFFVSFFICDC